MKVFSGFTNSTAQKLLLDAGAFFKNYDITKTYAENKAAGNLLGATQGGGSFTATPEVRQTEVDGVKGPTKGLENIDSWTVEMKCSLLENDANGMRMALGAADTAKVASGEAPQGYTKTTARPAFSLDDYYDNVAWVGSLSGSNDPVIIMVKNALSTGGLSLSFADKSEAKTEITMKGHYTEDDLDTPPFEIYHPIIGTAETEPQEKEVEA